MHIIYRNVRHEMLSILFHCAMLVWVMFIRVHLDALIIIARVLYDVNYCLLSELHDLSFSLHFVCASYEHELYMSFELLHAIFTEVIILYFCDLCGD